MQKVLCIGHIILQFHDTVTNRFLPIFLRELSRLDEFLEEVWQLSSHKLDVSSISDLSDKLLEKFREGKFLLFTFLVQDPGALDPVSHVVERKLLFWSLSLLVVAL